MPYLKIRTNLPVSRATVAAVVKDATALLAREFKRPADAVAIALESDTRLFLAGSDEPAAFAEITTGHLPTSGRSLGEALADLIHQHVGVPAAHVYVKFIASGTGHSGRAA